MLITDMAGGGSGYSHEVVVDKSVKWCGDSIEPHM